MKKLVLSCLIVATSGFGFLSCKKKEVAKKESSNNIVDFESKNKSSELFYVEENRLVVRDVDAFEQIVQMSNDEFDQSLVNLGYVSYKESTSSSSENLVGDDFLSCALNSDMAIQIGNFIYKINKPEQLIFAIPSIHSASYPDLISGNTSNPYVLSFSTEEDVFELLDERYADEITSTEGTNKSLSKNCAPSNFDQRVQQYGGEWTDEYGVYQVVGRKYKFHYKAKVRYDNWGIYRKLFSEFKHWESFWGTWNSTHFTFVYIYNYQAKNGASGSQTYWSPYNYWGNLDNTNVQSAGFGYDFEDDHKELIHYKSTRCLKSYSLSTLFWYRDRTLRKPRWAPNDVSTLYIHD